MPQPHSRKNLLLKQLYTRGANCTIKFTEKNLRTKKTVNFYVNSKKNIAKNLTKKC